MAQRPRGVAAKGLSFFSSPSPVLRPVSCSNLLFTLSIVILAFIQIKKLPFSPDLTSNNEIHGKYTNSKSFLRNQKNHHLSNNLLPRLRGGQGNNMFFVHPGSSRMINASMFPPIADFLDGLISVSPNSTGGIEELIGSKFPDVLNKLRTVNLTTGNDVKPNGLDSAPRPKLSSHKKLSSRSKKSKMDYSSDQQSSRRIIPKKKSYLKSRGKANLMEIYVRKPIPSDIYESKDLLLIRLDLPGVSKDSLSVECIRNNLVVTAKRRTAAQPPPGITRTTHHDEVQSGTYKRTFELPEAADATKITAEFKDGELYLRMPKKNLQKPIKIAIH